MVVGAADSRAYRRLIARMSTIYALGTKLGRAAIGVIRVLGPELNYIYSQLTRSKQPPTPRVSTLRRLYDHNHQMLDEALALYFKGPHSYTGEDLLELHVHGGTAIISLVLKAIERLHNPKENRIIRYAQNGEFSQRAFLNGRFDLTEIEGVREMIDAETETQRKAAVANMRGDTRALFSRWRQEILRQIALLTTVIDFGEEQDLDEVADLFNQVEANIDVLRREIKQYLRKVEGSRLLLTGINVVLLGPPNAGKLSLLNLLSNSDAAIVSDIAGTTRDLVRVPLDIEGYKVVVGDTAGIRELSLADSIEQEGISRAKSSSEAGDLVVVVLPLTQDLTQLGELTIHLDELKQVGKRILVVANKVDLVETTEERLERVQGLAQALHVPTNEIHVVSCTEGDGMEDLSKTLVGLFKDITMSESADPVVISERAQNLLVHDVLYGFDEFSRFKDDEDVVLASELLRQSVEGIGKITGDAIGIEEILGVVFSSFCIGK